MEMSPQTVRSTSFSVVKRGYDPDEVDAFKDQVAAAVEFSQNQATAMEARARAAVAKLQEVSQQVAESQRAAPPAAEPAPVVEPIAPAADAEVISRTLLLAQRTADAAIADARVEAEQVLQGARDEAARILEQASVSASRAVDEARAESRRAGEQERLIAENEVQALLARRDFLLADVEQLEQYVQAQRERLRDAANSIFDLVDRVPAGFAEMRRPLLSASAGVIDPAVAAVVEAAAPSAAPVEPPAHVAEATASPAAQPSFDDLTVTAEHPVVPPTAGEQFRIGGEELQ